jgi:NAD(P) transhydrogenase
MFSMAGTHVTMIDKRKEILANVDQEIVEVLLKRFMSLGMGFFLGHEVTAVADAPAGEPLRLTLSTGQPLEAEAVLIAQGRQGNTDALGLEKIGLPVTERGLLTVDQGFRTQIPHIFAVGDVVGFPALASTSMEQGRIAARVMFGLPCDTDLNAVYPYGIYTIPEISMIGETEQQLKARSAGYAVGIGPYREVARGQIVGDPWGMVKLLVDRRTRKLLGVHIIGDSAADLIHIGQAVMSLGGTIDYFIDRVFNYPTFAEAYKTAAYDALNALS